MLLQYTEKFKKDTKAEVVVEATIVFPVIIMVVIGLLVAGMYIHSKLVLQDAVQKALNAVAIESSDPTVRFDTDRMEYVENRDRKNYFFKMIEMFLPSKGGARARVKELVEAIYGKSLSMKGNISLEFELGNYLVYKQMIAKAKVEFTTNLNLSFIGIPKTFSVSARAKAMIHNPDEFIRNIDLAAEITDRLLERLGIKDKIDSVVEKIRGSWGKLKGFIFKKN